MSMRHKYVGGVKIDSQNDELSLHSQRVEKFINVGIRIQTLYNFPHLHVLYEPFSIFTLSLTQPKQTNK